MTVCLFVCFKVPRQTKELQPIWEMPDVFEEQQEEQNQQSKTKEK